MDNKGAQPQIPATRASLLDGLAKGEQASQQRFYRDYALLMYKWCRRAGLSHHDAEDMTADLTVKLIWQFEHNCSFDHKRSFRKWLKAVVNNAVRSFWRANSRLQFKDSDCLDQLTTETSLTDWVEENLVLCEAKEQVKLNCNSQHWSMFEMQTVEGRSAAETAAHFSVTPHVVHSAKHRVLEKIKRAVQQLSE